MADGLEGTKILHVIMIIMNLSYLNSLDIYKATCIYYIIQSYSMKAMFKMLAHLSMVALGGGGTSIQQGIQVIGWRPQNPTLCKTFFFHKKHTLCHGVTIYS